MTVIKQLQGYELSARDWEKNIFAKRVADYDSAMLDKLCLTGLIRFGRLSQLNEGKQIKLTRHVPLTFFVREDAKWLSALQRGTTESLSRCSGMAKSIYHFLEEKGASFFSDIFCRSWNSPLRSRVRIMGACFFWFRYCR